MRFFIFFIKLIYIIIKISGIKKLSNLRIDFIGLLDMIKFIMI